MMDHILLTTRHNVPISFFHLLSTKLGTRSKSARLKKASTLFFYERTSPRYVIHLFVSGRLLSCHGGDNTVENFLICSDEEVKKRLQKKAKKVRMRNNKRRSIYALL
jgi:hypothetical protein